MNGIFAKAYHFNNYNTINHINDKLPLSNKLGWQLCKAINLSLPLKYLLFSSAIIFGVYVKVSLFYKYNVINYTHVEDHTNIIINL